MLEVQLTFGERLGLDRLLPATGNFGTVRTVRKLKEAIEFTKAEQDKYALCYIPPINAWRWPPEHSKVTRKYKFNSSAKDLIRNLLKEADAAGKLDTEQASLYEKCMLDVTPAEYDLVTTEDS